MERIARKRQATTEETQEMRNKVRKQILRRNPHLTEKPEKLRTAINEEMSRIRDKHGDIR